MRKGILKFWSGKETPYKGQSVVGGPSIQGQVHALSLVKSRKASSPAKCPNNLAYGKLNVHVFKGFRQGRAPLRRSTSDNCARTANSWRPENIPAITCFISAIPAALSPTLLSEQNRIADRFCWRFSSETLRHHTILLLATGFPYV